VQAAITSRYVHRGLARLDDAAARLK